ncbi:hypothetical protein GCM10011517_12730 [Actibacterium pelagium]|uniref:Uncharacterized protein n=1 Tax=Actibacterium pelagium TaxID=2029103 RepID=A0A917AE93_9RHOB|nr:hypothetical protein GCM10011517_12730 [Actibacterium pelagium]
MLNAQIISPQMQVANLTVLARGGENGAGWGVSDSAAMFRNKFNEDTGNRRADAVNSNSPMLPRGMRVSNAPATTKNVPFRTHRRTEGMRNDG